MRPGRTNWPGDRFREARRSHAAAIY